LLLRLAETTPCRFILLGRTPIADEPTWAAGMAPAQLQQAAIEALQAQHTPVTPVNVENAIRPVLAQRELRNTLNGLEALGSQVAYLACDVADLTEKTIADMQAILQGWQAPISAVVHGAGLLQDEPLKDATLKAFDRVYRTKVHGLHALLQALDLSELKALVLFSSGAGYFGHEGQANYAMANEALNRWALKYQQQHTATHVLSINWGPWDGGMVNDSLKALFNARGIPLLPLEAGTALFVKALQAERLPNPLLIVGNDLSGSANHDSQTASGAPTAKKP